MIGEPTFIFKYYGAKNRNHKANPCDFKKRFFRVSPAYKYYGVGNE